MQRFPSLTLKNSAKVAITAVTVLAALWAGMQLWQHYEVDPWTRDGRIKANVVQIAPDVSGLVSAVRVNDNAAVEAGQILFDIDGRRFELARDQAQTAVDAANIARAQAAREVARNKKLSDLVAVEVREAADSHLQQTQSQLAQAKVSLDIAQLNLERSHIRAPTAGRITNFDLRTGAYVSAGHPVMALIEDDSFFVEGYFEETKLASIHIGDAVGITPMGEQAEIKGHVDSIAYGITDRDRSTGSNLLPNVNPTFNWVRLAQRIPVRVHIDVVPPGVRLVAGQTATVVVQPARPDAQKG